MEPAPSPARIADGEWEFRVDREWSRQATQPVTNRLTEDDYRSVPAGTRYSVVVSESCKRVEIREVTAPAGRPAMKGQRHEAEDGNVYWLHEGTFAGGHFVLRSGGKGLEAELTMFGSGVPITKSERGSLSKKL